VIQTKILVTGGNGFIGSYVALELYEAGHSVYVADIDKNEYMNSNFCTVNELVDLRNKSNCERLTKKMDRVFHFAANMGGIGFIRTVHAEVMYDNSMIDLNLLEACKKNKVPRMFYASSACAYPVSKQEHDPSVRLKESDIWPYDPEPAYGMEKLYTEKLCEAYYQDYGVETRIARFHNIYGPYGTWRGGKEKAPAALCRKVVEATNPGTIEVWGSGKQVRSFCYITDLVKGCIKLMESDVRDPLNLGTEEEVTIDELSDIIIRLSGKKLTKTYNESKPIGVNFRNADISRAKSELGWYPEVTLEEGIKTTYTWILQQVRETSKKKDVRSGRA
jgi:GDP-D-mannose 3',5'-epimerase